jgi:hypothetical protein
MRRIALALCTVLAVLGVFGLAPPTVNTLQPVAILTAPALSALDTLAAPHATVVAAQVEMKLMMMTKDATHYAIDDNLNGNAGENMALADVGLNDRAHPLLC